MTQSPRTGFIDCMPKAELHVHLEGTLEPGLSFALAQKNAIALAYGSPEELLQAYNFYDLSSFLAIYYKGMEVLKDEDDFFELTWAYLLKAREQNVVAMEALVEALPYKHWLIGVGLDSDDHGINSLEDPALCEVIRERGLGLTICPVSNRFCTQDLTATHIQRMLALGMRATVNSDDPAYFRAYMNENLQALYDEGHLTQAEIIQLVRNSFLASWLDDTRRNAYLERLQTYLAEAA